jgi:hypothetical protein
VALSHWNRRRSARNAAGRTAGSSNSLYSCGASTAASTALPAGTSRPSAVRTATTEPPRTISRCTRGRRPARPPPGCEAVQRGSRTVEVAGKQRGPVVIERVCDDLRGVGPGQPVTSAVFTAPPG